MLNIAENINIRMVTVQSTVDTGHEDMIHDAQMDFYGTRLATCSSDRSVKIFDVRDGTQTLAADLRGHEGGHRHEFQVRVPDQLPAAQG